MFSEKFSKLFCSLLSIHFFRCRNYGICKLKDISLNFFLFKLLTYLIIKCNTQQKGTHNKQHFFGVSYIITFILLGCTLSTPKLTFCDMLQKERVHDKLNYPWHFFFLFWENAIRQIISYSESCSLLPMEYMIWYSAHCTIIPHS